MRAVKHRLLAHFASLIVRHPSKIVSASIVLAVVSLIISLFFLQLDTDQDNLISKKIPYHQRYLEFLKEFGDAEYFLVVFEVPHGKEGEAKQALLSLVDRMNKRPDLFSEIRYRENLDILKNRALLTLPEKEFGEVATKLTEWRESLEELGRINNFAGLVDFASDNITQPLASLKKNADELEGGLTLFQDIVTGIDNPTAMAKLSFHDFFEPIIGGRYHQDTQGFLFSQSGRLLYLLAMPAKDYSTMQVVEEPLKFLRDELSEVKKIFPDIPAGITGRPVLQADEVISTGSDSLMASLASLAGVALLYMLYLKNLKRPLLIIASLVCGISWTLGMITLTLGHLNLLTVIFAIILIGIGVDYGMHFLLRYLKERQKGENAGSAIQGALTATGQGIITGGLCTAGAFYTALFSDFLGLQELGFVAGTGVLFCLVSQLITFPSLLYLYDRSPTPGKKTIVLPHLTRLDWCLKKPLLTLAVLVLATIWFLPYTNRLHFENNLLKLQDPGLESVIYEQKIMRDTGISSWFAVFRTPSKKELLEWQEKADQLKSVDNVESIFTLFPPDEGERRKVLAKIADQSKWGSSTAASFSSVEPLLSSLGRLQKALERLETAAFEGGEEKGVEKIDVLLDSANRLIKRFEKTSPALEGSIAQSQKIFFDLLGENKKILKNNLNPPSLDEEELPPNIKKRFKSDSGNYVLYVYPRQNIWEESFMKKFVDELRSVSPLASGPPIGVYESALRMKKGFVTIGILTMILVAGFLLIDFRSVKDSVIALLPLVSGMVWLAAGIHFLDIDLSLANFFALPILIGLGIDNGVHLMHHYRDKGDVREMLHTVAPAIILSTLTTLIGFGALSFVRHRGLASFGQIMSLGSVTCLIAALFVVPVVLEVLKKNRP